MNDEQLLQEAYAPILEAQINHWNDDDVHNATDPSLAVRADAMDATDAAAESGVGDPQDSQIYKALVELIEVAKLQFTGGPRDMVENMLRQAIQKAERLLK